MKLVFGTLCDYAGRGAKGKSNIIGMFSVFNFHDVPTENADRFYVYGIVAAENQDCGKTPTLEIKLLDQKGQPVPTFEKMTISSTVPDTFKPNVSYELAVAMEVNEVRFDSFGPYEVMFEVDGQEVGRFTVNVRQIGKEEE